MEKWNSDPAAERKTCMARVSDAMLFVCLTAVVSLGLWAGYGEHYFKVWPVFTGGLMALILMFCGLALHGLLKPSKGSVTWGWVALTLCAGLFWVRGAGGPNTQDLAGKTAGTFVSFSVNNGLSGVDVWVNDVCLGPAPVTLSASEFKATVHPWTHEPNEHSYVYSTRYDYASPGAGSSTVTRWQALQKSWTGYYVRFTRGPFDGYCRHASQGESHGGGRHETAFRFDLEFPGRDSYIRQLLNKARAMDYAVDDAWMEALDRLGPEAQDILFETAHFDALGQGRVFYLDAAQWPVSEPGMAVLMEQWLTWKYGWSSAMESDQAFEILKQMIEGGARYERNRQVGFIVWAVRRLVPYLDAQQVAQWILPSLLSGGFDWYADTYWPTRLFAGISYPDDDLRQRAYLKLDTLFCLDRHLDAQQTSVNPVEAAVVPAIMARYHGTAYVPALRIALLLDHPDLKACLFRAWKRSQQGYPQTPQARGWFSGEEKGDPWLYLLAHLRGEAGRQFRAQYAESILDMTQRLFAEKPGIWTFYFLTFTDLERMEGEDVISSRVFLRLAETLDNGTSSGDNPQLWLWDQILRTEPLCAPELYAQCWRHIEDRGDALCGRLAKLTVLPPVKRQSVLKAVIKEISSNPGQVLDLSRHLPDVKAAEKVVEYANAMLERSGPQGQANHYLERRDHLSDYALRWLLEQRPGTVAADFYAASASAATRLKAVTLYSAHATAHARAELTRLLDDPDSRVQEAASRALNELKALAALSPEALNAADFNPPASGQTLSVRHYRTAADGSYEMIAVPLDVVWGLTQTPWAQDQWRGSPETHGWAGRQVGGHDLQKSPLIDRLSELPDTGIYVIDPNDQSRTVRDTLNGTCFVWDGAFTEDRLDTRSANREDAVFADADGSPVAGAQIAIRCQHRDTGSVLWLGGHVTDTRGRIPVSTVKGDYFCHALKVSHPDFEETTRALDFRDIRGLRLYRLNSLAHRRMMFGQVVDANGMPLDGARIRITALKRETDTRPTPGGQYASIPADAQGRFRFLPSGQNIPEMPPVAEYQLEVRPPEGRALLPHVGWHPNGQEITIQMIPARTKHRFRFEDAEGKVMDARTIRPLRLELRTPEGGRLFYSEDQVKEGVFLPPGTLSAGDSFDPVVITEDSPQTIVFRKKQSRVLRGRVLDVVTGKPISRVLIVNYEARRNDGAVSEFTDKDWNLLDQWMISDPGHPGRALIERLFADFTAARTDEQGRFTLTVPPASTYFMMALGRARVPHRFRTQDTKMDDQRAYAFEDIHLVPAARLVLDIDGPEQRQTFYAELDVIQDRAPHWWQAHDNLSLRYPADVRSGGKQTVLVAASVPFDLQIRALRGPWSSVDLPGEYLLAPGQVLDLGRLRPEPAVEVSVRVIDGQGHPVEGMRISVRYDKPSYGMGQPSTDPEGRSCFYVNAHAEGEIWAFKDYDQISEGAGARFTAEAISANGSDIVIVME
ncbi:MAG: hypothetical protein K9N55_00280 [Phycisphaerae bacterium]|nr:hypothetical protein [Phycisphaerae bacterium]